MQIGYCALLLALSSTATAAFNVGRSNHLPLTGGTRAVSVPIDVPISTPEEKQPNAIESDTTLLLDPKDEWIAKLDYDAFSKDVTDLGKQLLKETGDADVKHLNKIVQWRNIAAIIGLSTVWTTPNPVTIVALSTWTYSSWTMVAHHVCHGGYNRVDAGRS